LLKLVVVITAVWAATGATSLKVNYGKN